MNMKKSISPVKLLIFVIVSTVIFMAAAFYYGHYHSDDYGSATIMSGIQNVANEMMTMPDGDEQEFGTILVVDKETGVATLAYFPTEDDFPGCRLLTRRNREKYVKKTLDVEIYKENGKQFISSAEEIIK